MTCSDNEKIIVEKSKRSSYQSLINSVSCIKPFDNFDFVCRVLFSHVFLLLVVEQGPPFSMTFCIAVMLSSKLRNSGCRCAWVPSEFSSSSSLILDLTGFDLTNERIHDC